MKPLISICLPNYNYGKFLKEAIDSVLAQSYANFELIIGDNASTDNSEEIIKSYGDPRIRFYQNENNIPLYSNINKCKSLAKGDLIAILHSDDKYEADFLLKVVNFYKKHPNKKVFVTGVNFWHFEENYIIPWHPYASEGVKSGYEVFLRLAVENNIGNGVNVVLHRDCFRGKEIFSDSYKYSADYDLWLRLAKKYDFVYIPEILTYYRIHNSNLSHTVNKNLDMFKEGIEIFENNFTDSHLIPARIRQDLRYIQNMHTIYKTFNFGIKYKSGEISRNMLKYLKETDPKLKFELNWYITYLLSYLIKENLSGSNFVSLLGKLTFYPNKIHTKNSLEKLIRHT